MSLTKTMKQNQMKVKRYMNTYHEYGTNSNSAQCMYNYAIVINEY